MESILISLFDIAPTHVPELGMRFNATAFLLRLPVMRAQTVTQYSEVDDKPLSV